VHPLCADPEEIWWTQHDLDQAARTITRRAIAQSPAPNDVVAAVCSLIVIDPRNREHVDAVASAILRDAATDPLWRTTANGWRPHLPSWIRPGVVGSTVQRLVAVGLLTPTGRYVRCSDTEARNGGKPQPVYEVDITALAAVEDVAAGDSAGWRHWTANRMARRQTAVHRAVLKYGTAFVSVLPGDPGALAAGHERLLRRS
jgi:hypothetical protein